jgi:hypothetical protein
MGAKNRLMDLANICIRELGRLHLESGEDFIAAILFGALQVHSDRSGWRSLGQIRRKVGLKAGLDYFLLIFDLTPKTSSFKVHSLEESRYREDFRRQLSFPSHRCRIFVLTIIDLSTKYTQVCH